MTTSDTSAPARAGTVHKDRDRGVSLYGSRGVGPHRSRGVTRRGLPVAAGIMAGLLTLTGCDAFGGDDKPEQAGHEYTVSDDVQLSASPIWSDADEAAMLRIAVPFDTPNFGYLPGQQAVPAGFAVEIGRIVAGRLGFADHQITWVDAGPNPPERISGESPAADLLISLHDQPVSDAALRPPETTDGPETTDSPESASPSASGEAATGRPEHPADMAGPYHRGGQALLLPAASTTASLDELTEAGVCAQPDTAARTLLEGREGITVIERGSLADCAAAVSAAQADAAVGPDLALQALAAEDQQALHVSSSVEEPGGYYIRLREADATLSAAIDEGLAAAIEDEEWQEAAEQAFGAEAELTPPAP